MKPSPLRHLDLSDDTRAADLAAEKARELINAYERIEELQDGIRGLLSLIRTIENNQRGVSQVVRDSLSNHHRVIEAQELLR